MLFDHLPDVNPPPLRFAEHCKAFYVEATFLAAGSRRLLTVPCPVGRPQLVGTHNKGRAFSRRGDPQRLRPEPLEHARPKAHGVPVEVVGAKEAHEIEMPHRLPRGGLQLALSGLRLVGVAAPEATT